MTNLTPSRSNRNKQRFTILEHIFVVAFQSIKKMEQRYFQLNQIFENSYNEVISEKASNYITKQVKLLRITFELLSRLENVLVQSKIEQTISDETLQQYINEVNILNAMDFEVTKTYFAFIHNYHKAKVIQLKSMAA